MLTINQQFYEKKPIKKISIYIAISVYQKIRLGKCADNSREEAIHFIHELVPILYIVYLGT